MVQSLKRQAFPVDDWELFLKEGKEEFYRVMSMLPVKSCLGSDDFELVRILGKGGFGTVYLAMLKKYRELFALKILRKREIVKGNMVGYIIREKNILQSINFPFCVHSQLSFQDNSYLYICLPFFCGKDLFTLLKDRIKLEESHARFYGAQVLLALEYLHHLDIVHRDLKPENIIIDGNGYLKVIDFGLSKIIKGRTYSMCGTPRYIAPEIILNLGHGKAVDWWCFGILLYDMCAGRTPFYCNDLLKTNEKIILGEYSKPDFFSPELTHLIENILQVNLSRRYGNLRRGVRDIKEHHWFNGMNWIALLNQSVVAPYLPEKLQKVAEKVSPIRQETTEQEDYSEHFKSF